MNALSPSRAHSNRRSVLDYRIQQRRFASHSKFYVCRHKKCLLVRYLIKITLLLDWEANKLGCRVLQEATLLSIQRATDLDVLKNEYGKEFDILNLKQLFKCLSVGEAVDWESTTRPVEARQYWRNFFATMMLLAHRCQQDAAEKSAIIDKMRRFPRDSK